jgi:hypothetical protein
VLLVDDLRLGPVSSVLPKTLSDPRGLDLSASELEVLDLLGILHQVTAAQYDTVPYFGIPSPPYYSVITTGTRTCIAYSTKVVTNEKQGVSGRWQMIDISLGPW